MVVARAKNQNTAQWLFIQLYRDEFWEHAKDEIPAIYELYIQIRSCAPSTGYIERIHSWLTLTIGSRRHKLKAERLFKMVFIRSMIKGCTMFKWSSETESEVLDDSKCRQMLQTFFDAKDDELESDEEEYEELEELVAQGSEQIIDITFDTDEEE